MSTSGKGALSAPFQQRELNGETLLEELRDLRAAGVNQKHLNDCALAMRELARLSPTEAVTRLKALSQRFGDQKELASTLNRWSAKVKNPGDVPALCSHFERLALASGLFSAMMRGAGRLSRGARK